MTDITYTKTYVEAYMAAMEGIRTAHADDAARASAKLANDAARVGTFAARFPMAKNIRTADAAGVLSTPVSNARNRAVAHDDEPPKPSSALVESFKSAEQAAVKLLKGPPPERHCPPMDPLEQSHITDLQRDTLTELGLKTEDMTDEDVAAAFYAEVKKLTSERPTVAAQDSRVGRQTFEARFPMAGRARTV